MYYVQSPLKNSFKIIDLCSIKNRYYIKKYFEPALSFLSFLFYLDSPAAYPRINKKKDFPIKTKYVILSGDKQQNFLFFSFGQINLEK